MSLFDLAIVLFLRVGIVLVLYAFLLALIVAVRHDLSSEPQARTEVHEQLIVLDPGESQLRRGQTLPLLAVTPMGRDSQNAIVVEDEFVSAVHASAFIRDGRWWLRDEGSTNGTVLNGNQIAEEVALETGDELQVGHVRFQVLL